MKYYLMIIGTLLLSACGSGSYYPNQSAYTNYGGYYNNGVANYNPIPVYNTPTYVVPNMQGRIFCNNAIQLRCGFTVYSCNNGQIYPCQNYYNAYYLTHY